MGQYMDEKTKWIESYIKRCDDIERQNNASEANDLVEEILSVFLPELPQIGAYVFVSEDSNVKKANRNISLVRAKLKNYILNLRCGLQKHLYADNGIHVEQTTMQNVENTVSVSVTQTAEMINRLPDSVLTSDEKELLNGKLMSIETSPDKSTRWEKAKSALKWIAEKSIEVGTAALPYIVEALKR